MTYKVEPSIGKGNGEIRISIVAAKELLVTRISKNQVYIII